MKLDINYYFENIKNDEIFKKLTENANSVLEIYKNRKDFIEDYVEKNNVKENNGTILGNEISLSGNYYIGEGTKLYEGCRIEGPVYIGKNCEIMYQAYIRPGTVIGDNCIVGFNSEVKKTVMRDGSKLSSLAFVGDSILGASCRVGSGAIVANRKFNQKNIFIKLENGEKLDTDMEFMGGVIGDNSRLGCNVVTSPGTFIGPYTWIYPLVSVHGFIPAQKKVYNQNNLVIEENEKTELKKATWQKGNHT